MGNKSLQGNAGGRFEGDGVYEQDDWQILLQNHHMRISCDVVLCAESADSCKKKLYYFPVHKDICVAASEHFSQLFILADTAIDTRWRKKTLPVVTFAQHSAEALEIILRSIYLFPFPSEKLNFRLAWEVRAFATIANLPQLISDMDVLIVRKLTPANFCKALKRYGNSQAMIDRCMAHLPRLDRHWLIVRSPEFLDLKLFPHLCTLLKSQALKVANEVVWDCCEKWLGKNTDKSMSSSRRRIKLILRTFLDVRSSCMEMGFLGHDLDPIKEELDTSALGSSLGLRSSTAENVPGTATSAGKQYAAAWLPPPVPSTSQEQNDCQ